MKRMNVFGRTSDTIGQNLMRAVTGIEQAIGILPYNYDKMLSILVAALTALELDILCRGYGINCHRRTQKVIAVELGMSEIQVSEISNKAIQKLKASPYKVQLEKLVPTIWELGDLIEKLKSQQIDPREFIKTRNRLAATDKLLKVEKESNKQLREEKESLSYEKERLLKRLEVIEQQLNETTAKAAELSRQLDDEKFFAEFASEVFCDVMESLKKDYQASTEKAKQRFATSLIHAKKNRRSLEGLHLSQETLDALYSTGIVDIDKLCEMSHRTLTSMISKKRADEVQSKLREVAGLGLRIG